MRWLADSLCCVVACMQQNFPSPLVFMSVSLALLQGHCRHSKPRPNPIPAGCAGHPGKNKRVIWMVARQHPGEAMAEWFVEGFLDRLTDPHDGASMRVLEHAVFYVVGIASSSHPNLLYCTLHAAGIVSYQNDSVSWSILTQSTALGCFAAACMPVQLVSGVQN